MAFDYKKEYNELYMPKGTPYIVIVPNMNYIAVRGSGDPNDEPVTLEAMHRLMEEQGYVLDITDQRMHHEIYLSDARKVAPEKLKTVIRHPIKVKGRLYGVHQSY